MRTNDPESIDLEALGAVLRRVCGHSVAGAVLGRTRLRDEVSRHLGCSLLMSEQVVDTMIARGFIRQQVHPDGWVYWAMP
jgi:predicted DNA-binding transcriptional regulator